LKNWMDLVEKIAEWEKMLNNVKNLFDII
jgi:hypothetical protein